MSSGNSSNWISDSDSDSDIYDGGSQQRHRRSLRQEDSFQQLQELLRNLLSNEKCEISKTDITQCRDLMSQLGVREFQTTKGCLSWLQFTALRVREMLQNDFATVEEWRKLIASLGRLNKALRLYGKARNRDGHLDNSFWDNCATENNKNIQLAYLAMVLTPIRLVFAEDSSGDFAGAVERKFRELFNVTSPKKVDFSGEVQRICSGIDVAGPSVYENYFIYAQYLYALVTSCSPKQIHESRRWGQVGTVTRIQKSVGALLQHVIKVMLYEPVLGATTQNMHPREPSLPSNAKSETARMKK